EYTPSPIIFRSAESRARRRRVLLCRNFLQTGVGELLFLQPGDCFRRLAIRPRSSARPQAERCSLGAHKEPTHFEDSIWRSDKRSAGSTRASPILLPAPQFYAEMARAR